MSGPLTARQAVEAVTGPLLLIAIGALFLFDYSGGVPVRQTWPVVLILFGLSLALQSVLPRQAAKPAGVRAPRKSLFGPIVLIGLGTALLAKNLDPDIPLRGWFASHWPWIFIIWGAFRLCELGLARLAGWAPPRNLGAGAVLGAALLILAGTAARSEFPRSWDLRIELGEGVETFERGSELAPFDGL